MLYARTRLFFGRARVFFSKFAAVRLEHFGLGRPLPVLVFELPPQLAVVVAVRLERRVDRVELGEHNKNSF